MVKQLAATAILVGIVALAAVACGGGDDQEAPAAAAAAPPAETTPAATTNGETPTSVNLSQNGDTVDLTVHITENTSVIGRVEGENYVPSEINFRVGQTVNFTIVPPPESRLTHSFSVREIGINQLVKFGNPATLTYTFDKLGTFKVFSILRPYSVGGDRMTGTITVVE